MNTGFNCRFYCQTLINSSISRDLQSVPSSLIDVDSISRNKIPDRRISKRECFLLHQIDSSIDYHRFTVDSEYRRLTMIGLFMFYDPPLTLGE